MSRPLLVTGAAGYLGGELLRRAPAVGTWHTTPPPTGRECIRLDVRDGAAVRRELERLRPRAVVHTAYSQADRTTTRDGSVAVAQAAAAVGARLVHLSTDLLFDGEKAGAYTEQDEPRPLSDYGRAKAEAERGVLEACPRALIVRTSLLYGGADPGHQERIALAAAAGRADTRFFVDELRSPVHVGDLAAALLELVDLDVAGVLHVAGADVLDRYELARRLAATHGADPAALRPSTIAESGLARPRNCALSIERARALLRAPLRGAREVLRL